MLIIFFGKNGATILGDRSDCANVYAIPDQEGVMLVGDPAAASTVDEIYANHGATIVVAQRVR